MMNKYLGIELEPAPHGIGGSFHTQASFRLDNFQASFLDIEVKIDTGCSISTIPLKRLKVSDSLCRHLKQSDISNHIPYFLSYGIESGGLKHKTPITNAEKMECPAMKFVHEISDFTIGGVKIPSDQICLNYDRRGNILIGMDILNDWDIHIGISKKTGKTLFLACPMKNKCAEYSDALKKHFDLEAIHL